MFIFHYIFNFRIYDYHILLEYTIKKSVVLSVTNKKVNLKFCQKMIFQKTLFIFQ